MVLLYNTKQRWSLKLDIISLIDKINNKLQQLNLQREITVIGGAALIISGSFQGVTMDIDMLRPKHIDPDLKKIANEIQQEEGLYSDWINTASVVYEQKLLPGWKSRVEIIKDLSNLKILSLSRRDTLFQKLVAHAERQFDLAHLKSLNPSLKELQNLYPKVLVTADVQLNPFDIDETFNQVA